MNKFNNGNVLYVISEIQNRSHRGIYSFSKAVINTLHRLGFRQGLLTQSLSTGIDLDLNSVLKDVYLPPSYPKYRTMSSIVDNYIKLHAGYESGVVLEVDWGTQIIKDTRFEFLRAIDNIVNFPLFYRTCAIAQKLPLLFSSVRLPVGKIPKNTILFSTAPLNFKCPSRTVVQTIHDLIPIEFESVSSHRFKATLQQAVNADKILSVSQYTKSRILEYFPKVEEKIEVVYQPVHISTSLIEMAKRTEIQESVLRKYNLKRKQFMLYVGAIEYRKNIHTLIAAYNKLSKDDCAGPLVLSGGVNTSYVKNYNLNLNSEGTSVRYLGYLNDLEKLCLISSARAFVFPSLSEGFGIPVVEAQMMMTPVLTSNVTSLPEVVNQSALLLEDPTSVDEMVFKLTKLWISDELCANLAREGFLNSARFSQDNFLRNMASFMADIS